MAQNKRTTKETILQISFETFLNNGFEQTTMDNLVKASGLSKGAFYHYFPNKKALYNAVIDLYILSYYQTIKWEAYEGLSFNEIEKAIKSFYIGFVNEINNISNNGLANYYVMFFEASKYHPEFINNIQQFYFQLKKAIDKATKRENLDLNAMSIIAKHEGILFWILIFPNEKIEKLINEL